MLTCTLERVNAGEASCAPARRKIRPEYRRSIEGGHVAEVQIQDGIIRILELDIQDQKAAAALAEYPQARWAEITRRALKIGLGYMKGGARD